MRLGMSASRKHRKGKFLIYVCLLAVFASFYWCTCKLQPAFVDCSYSYANNMVNRVVNDAVTEVFKNEEYKELSSINSHTNSSVQTIETNTAKINTLKAQLNDRIQENIKSCQAETVKIPIGSASRFYILAGLGPKMPIRIYPVSIVNTDIEEKLDSAGINQVNHRLYLNVSIDVSFAGLTFVETSTVETKVLLTETMIVGDTPEYYGSGNVSTSLK